jgi:hypothetical protein
VDEWHAERLYKTLKSCSLFKSSLTSTNHARPVTYDKAMAIVDQVADVIIPPIRTHMKHFNVKNVQLTGKRLTKSLSMPTH